MIERLLIANRGECARRVAYTCEELGKTPIAVYTPDDKNSLHVREEKKAYEIPDYTDIRSIIKVARMAEVDAIHPGWGFVSEDPRFPKACEKAGIIFIGPTVEAMREAGDKKRVKQIAKKLGIPVIASSSRVKQSGILDWASKHGLTDEPDSVPMMLKVARSGGGSGNKVVLYRKDLEKEANKLAESSERRWRRSKILVESLVRKARHVEVQLFGDQNGNVVHLGTRDCSVQLNHQKVMEEAPAHFLTDEQEKLLLEYALAIGKAVGYSNAGTAEFLIAPKEGIRFMELNTRLQVEHGITEFITNQDLVKMQILVAEGNSLPSTQEEIDFYGTAIEARVNAHPSGGVVEEVVFPKGKNVRVDHALYEGYEINLNYNPTQAKVMAWSASRAGAIETLRKSLEGFEIKGVETNIPVLLSVLSDPGFIEGKHTTTFFEEMLRERAEVRGVVQENKEKAAAIGVALALALQERQKQEEVVVFRRNASLWRQAGRLEQTNKGLNFGQRRR